MKAGTYFIGDLVYAMTDVEWDELCEITIKGTKAVYGEFELSDGRKFALYPTNGEGNFYDQHDNEYKVMSGCVGCIKTSDITLGNAMLHNGSICLFEDDFPTGSDKQNVSFGNISISLSQNQ